MFKVTWLIRNWAEITRRYVILSLSFNPLYYKGSWANPEGVEFLPSPHCPFPPPSTKQPSLSSPWAEFKEEINLKWMRHPAQGVRLDLISTDVSFIRGGTVFLICKSPGHWRKLPVSH